MCLQSLYSKRMTVKRRKTKLGMQLPKFSIHVQHIIHPWVKFDMKSAQKTLLNGSRR